MQKFLVIQTAYIGDVVLATGLIEKLHQYFPEAQIDFLVRKGNEGLLEGHPLLHEVLVWNKREHKQRHWRQLLRVIRSRQYDKVINVQRFTATGLWTALSGAKEKIGFDKNPLSRFFTHRVKHLMAAEGGTEHEIARNQALIQHFTDAQPAKPRLYPTTADREAIARYRQGAYLVISPASVWFTKQYPAEKWIAFINKVSAQYTIYILGGKTDRPLGELIRRKAERPAIINLCGQVSYLQSVALMEGAAMNYANDSAPMHFASAVNAPVTAIYCSTVPSFGYGPLSDQSHIVEVEEKLDCRPCGLHGHQECPKGHFSCAHHIRDEQLLATLHS